jgi:hypothetical protein
MNIILEGLKNYRDKIDPYLNTLPEIFPRFYQGNL